MNPSSALPGRLVVIEGPDGAGKTDLVSSLAEHLGARGEDVVALREPGGSDLGERIRTILKDPTAQITDRAELLLFCAARAQLFEQVIAPALQAGKTVLLDRCEDSTIIYQGIARGLGEQVVRQMSGFARGGVDPDRVLVLLVRPEVAAERMRSRDGEVGDRIESSIDMDVIRDQYALVALRSNLDPTGSITSMIDANGTREETLQQAIEVLDEDRAAQYTAATTGTEAALHLALAYGQIDGDHHKMWVIDQMVRALTGGQYSETISEYERGTEEDRRRYADDPLDEDEVLYQWDRGIAP